MAITSPPQPPMPTDNEDAFIAKSEAWLNWQYASASEFNALADDVSAQSTAAEVAASLSTEASYSALAAANYKGLWSSLSGALAVPASTWHAGAFWVLTESVADVAAEEPSVSAKWKPSADRAPGDIVITGRALPMSAPAWLPADGSVYLQASYPALFSAIGHVNAYDPAMKLPDPAALPNTGTDCEFSSSGTYLAATNLTTLPYLTIYKRSGDTFAKLANPADQPTGSGQGVGWSADETYLAVAHLNTPFLTIYKRSGDTFTKLANPATLPAGAASRCAFSPDGTYLCVAHVGSPYLTIYKRSGDTFTKLANPSALPAGNLESCAFSPDWQYLAVVGSVTPFLTIYKRSGDTFTKLADPAVMPTGTAMGCVFSPDGAHLAVAHQNAPYLTIYKRSGDTFTKLKTPLDIPPNSLSDCAYTSDGDFLLTDRAIYRRAGDTYTRLEDTEGWSVANGIAASPVGDYIARVGGSPNTINVFAPVTHDRATQFSTPKIKQRVLFDAFIKT